MKKLILILMLTQLAPAQELWKRVGTSILPYNRLYEIRIPDSLRIDGGGQWRYDADPATAGFRIDVLTDTLYINGYVNLGTNILVGQGGSAFSAKTDSNALEFTSSTVQYRAILPAYAKLYHDTTTAYSVSLGTADSFYTIKNWNRSLSIRKNASITDSSIIVRVPGVYQIYYSISSGSSSANTVLKTSIFRNFSRVGGTSAEQKIATANDIGDMSAMGFLYCSAGDYIQIRVRRESGAGTCDIYNAQLVVTRID